MDGSKNKKVIWQHPSCHDSKTWVESFEFTDKEGRKYLARFEDDPIRTYLDQNKGIRIK
jgi:hypothetical protein